MNVDEALAEDNLLYLRTFSVIDENVFLLGHSVKGFVVQESRLDTESNSDQSRCDAKRCPYVLDISNGFPQLYLGVQFSRLPVERRNMSVTRSDRQMSI